MMRVAQVSPLYESVPPRPYGGTERVVHSLTAELVRRGDGDRDSRPPARPVAAGCRKRLRTGVYRAHQSGETGGSPHRDCAKGGHAPEDCCKDRKCRPKVFRGADTTPSG